MTFLSRIVTRSHSLQKQTLPGKVTKLDSESGSTDDAFYFFPYEVPGMKTETRMDCLLQRIEEMNDLLDLRQVENEEESGDTTGKTGGKRGGKSGKTGGFFGTVVGEIFFRRSGVSRPGILQIIHPSDGHPQEELSPDFGWFRPLSFNNATWTLYWPDLII